MSYFEDLISGHAFGDQLACAIAYAGAVEAISRATGGSASYPEAEGNVVSWAMPGAEAQTHLAGADIPDLAERWASDVATGVTGPMRLVWNVRAEENSDVLKRVLPIFGAADPDRDRSPFIFLIATGGFGDHTWSWPPRIDLGHARHQFENDFPHSMISRGLARIWQPHMKFDDPDYRLLGPDYASLPITGAEMLAGQPTGLNLRCMEGADPMHIGALAMRALNQPRTPPTVILPLSEKQALGAVDIFLRELTHNLPPDLALVKAIASLRPAGQYTAPLVLIGPEDTLPTAFARARPVRWLADLLHHLAVAPRDAPLTDLNAPRLIGSGPKTVAGLRRRLRWILQNPDPYFDQESGGASEVEALWNTYGPIPVAGAGPIRGDDMGAGVGKAETTEDAMIPDDFYDPFEDAIESDDVGATDTETETEAEPDGHRGDLFAFDDLLDKTFGAPSRPEPALETERYVDVALYPGEGYDEDALAPNEALASFAPYSIGVAIRAERSGIDASDAAPAIKPPRADRETARLWVIVDTPTRTLIDLPDPISQIVWPFDSDTEEVFIRFATREESTEDAVLTISLYSEDLNFLERVQIKGLRIGRPSALKLTRPDPQPAELTPRDMGQKVDLQINEDVLDGARRLTVLAHRPEEGDKIQLFQRDVPIAEAIKALDRVRSQMEKLATGLLQDRDGVSAQTLNTRILPELAQAGTQAWKALFGPSRSGISKLISFLDKRSGLRVQITTTDNSGGFVFPYAFLCAPLGFNEEPTWDRLWGLRHDIDIWPGAFRRSGLEAAPFTIATAEDHRFEGQDKHRATLEQLAAAKGITLEPPAASGDMLFKRMDEEPAHLYYFFCHGSAPNPMTLDRSLRENLLDEDLLTAQPAHEAVFSFTGGELSESDLDELSPYRRRRPIFFLNMCQSAELSPGHSSGLVRSLLGCGAAAVLGTEAEMTSVFASRFAEDVLKRIFDGASVGAAVLGARKTALDAGNPLGLAYSLYGRGESRLGP